jgi:5-methyltetrahydropteroyltriglutamate--homocysteine methyltransferase
MDITQLKPDAKEILKRNKVQLTYARAVVSEELRDSVIARDEFEAARKYSKKPFKVTLPAPYLVMWESWHKTLSKEAYSTPEDFGYAYAKLLRREVLRLKDAGVSFIQLDEPMLGDLTEAGEKPDRYRRVFRELYGQEYRGFKEELKLAVDLLNQVIRGVGGVRLGVHMDRWPNKDSPYFDIGYERFLPELLEARTKQLVLEYTTPGTGDPTKLVKEFPDSLEIGFGCISVQDYEVETPELVVSRVRRITSHIEPERIWLNPDCGFAPGMFRTFPRDVAFAKLRSMTRAAEILREENA